MKIYHFRTQVRFCINGSLGWCLVIAQIYPNPDSLSSTGQSKITQCCLSNPEEHGYIIHMNLSKTIYILYHNMNIYFYCIVTIHDTMKINICTYLTGHNISIWQMCNPQFVWGSNCWESSFSLLPMMTSSNGNNFRLLALCVKNSLVTGEFPLQRPVIRSFDVFFDQRLNKWLSKQSWGRWFEKSSCRSWRHCTELHQTD